MKKLTLAVFLLLITQAFSNNPEKNQQFGIETIASYYSDYYHGRITANGEIFDQNKLTCAHKTLPFGTRIKVTNLKSNDTVIVTVNDRGPFIKGRDVDLSKKAFSKLGDLDKGLLKVKYEIIN